jgi:hypothetical protein
MDSLDLFLNVVWDRYDRARADAKMLEILRWVGQNARPDDVFNAGELDVWARFNGYSRSGADADLIAALREASRYVPADVNGRIMMALRSRGVMTA